MSALKQRPPRKRLSLPVSFILGLIVLNLFGCRGEEDITRTTERRIEYNKSEAPKAEKVPTRILGVIAPGDEGTSWFFKLMGPAEAVAGQQAAFDQFLSTIEFNKKADKPVTWTLPEGWREGPRKGRYATILIGPGDEPLELSVMPAGGDLLDNVNRWRGQLGLAPLHATGLPAILVHRTTRSGLAVTLVDFANPAATTPSRMLGAMVPFNGATWFFKLTGPDAAVAAQKPAFLAFLDTVTAP